jgi:peptidoglycan/xylan/chitin deacetylase (PgdA/CDA1 family)
MAKLTRSRRKRILTAFVWLLLAVSFVLAYQPLWAYGVLARVFPDILWRVETEAPLVALTFDDGPDSTWTPQVLDVLAKHGARATFFLIAEHALRRPDLVERIRAEGHEIGNHYTTRRSTLVDTDAQFAENLAYTAKLIGIEGQAPLLFRPPSGRARPEQLRHARDEGYTIVLGSAYPWDPAPPPAAYVRWLASKNLAPGVIVILHDGIDAPTSHSLEALPGILEAGRERGLRFVTVGEMMASASGVEEARGRQTRNRPPRPGTRTPPGGSTPPAP